MNKLPPILHPMANPALARLQRQIGALEGGRPGLGEADAVSFGLPALDAALPWGGLPRGALHEITGGAVHGGPHHHGGLRGSALGFAVALLARMSADPFGPSRPVLWCRTQNAVMDHGSLYGPGLAAAGLNPRQIIFVTLERSADLMWALEEGIRCDALSAVVGEGAAPDFTAGRRLQLAARGGRSLVLMLPPGLTKPGPTAALTRWQVSALSSDALEAGGPRADTHGGVLATKAFWRVDLQQCRGGRPASWKVEWNDAALSGAVAMPLADGSMEEPAARAAAG